MQVKAISFIESFRRGYYSVAGEVIKDKAAFCLWREDQASGELEMPVINTAGLNIKRYN